MKLREIAYSRCGDKSDISNVSVFPYKPEDWERLRSFLTAEVVKAHYGDLVQGQVTRYEYPKIQGLNFVLEHALGGGASVTLRPDALGKSMQSLILNIEVPGESERG